jgi:hypothetical protein
MQIRHILIKITFKSFPQKPLNQIKPNLAGVGPTTPAKFALIWFRGFREDLNVIFYQNMPNLHNRYKSAERKISQKNLEYMLNYSNCVRQHHPPFKMTAVTKNRNFFNCSLLL